MYGLHVSEFYKLRPSEGKGGPTKSYHHQSPLRDTVVLILTEGASCGRRKYSKNKQNHVHVTPGAFHFGPSLGTASPRPFRTQPNAAMSTIFPDQSEERDISGLRTVFDPETLVKKGALQQLAYTHATNLS